MLDTSDRVNELCKTCPKRDTCREPCPALNSAINAGRLMEKYYDDRIELFPFDNREIHVSSLGEENLNDDGTPKGEALKLSTDGIKTSKTKIFVEHFFNKRDFKEISDELEAKEKTVREYYRLAIQNIERTIAVLEKKQVGVFYVKKGRLNQFSERDKCFLLHYIFGFTVKETAEILGMTKKMAQTRVLNQRDKYETMLHLEQTA